MTARVFARLVDSVRGLGHQLINLLARLGHYRLTADIAFGEQARQRLDYYLYTGPAAAAAAERPLVLFIYGGGWQSGAKADYRFVASTLCDMGLDVVIADYRLYPQVRFAQMLDDVCRSAQWLAANTPARQPVFVMGHSAGAQLGALLCLNPALLARAGNLQDRLQGFIGLAGPYDFYPFTEAAHWDLFAPAADYPLSQAVNFVRADAVPLYLLHGEDDRRVRRGHSKSLMEKVNAAGGRARREVYASMGHVDIIVQFSALHRRNSEVVRHIAEFVRDPG